MNKVMTLHGTEAEEMLRTAIDKKVPAILSYLSRNKWYVAKVLLTSIEDDKLYIESALAHEKHPINIQLDQPVGISFKYEYGKFIFDTTVLALEPSPNSRSSGRIALVNPVRIEVIQRRSYFRVNVPDSIKVHVVLWHRKGQRPSESKAQHETGKYYDARLIDISAGGAQILMHKDSAEDKPDFKQGQFIGMRFTPLPYEMPLMICAQVRNVLPRNGDDGNYLGLQLVGLEASSEGQEVLTRLVGIIERYRTMNQENMSDEEAEQFVGAVEQ